MSTKDLKNNLTKLSSSLIVDYLKEGKNLIIEYEDGKMIINSNDLTYELISKHIRVKYYFNKDFKVIKTNIIE